MGSTSAIVLSGSSNAVQCVLLCATICLGSLLSKLAWLSKSSAHELYGSWQLHKMPLQGRLAARIMLLLSGVFIICVASSEWLRLSATMFILSGEFIGRYLFFVSVVPSDIASGYLAREAA
jgi:hypothetical protein